MPRLKRVPVEEEKPRTKTPNSESTGKKMGFFVDLLNLSHISYDNAAALAGMSKSCIYYWITVDNAKLSQVMNVIEGLGYSLRIILSRNEGDDAKITPVDINDLLMSNNCKPKRLSFLTIALVKYAISKKDLASRLNVTNKTIGYYFSQDDILISRIFDIAKACDLSVNFDIVKRQEAPVADNGIKGASSKRFFTVHLEQTVGRPL